MPKDLEPHRHLEQEQGDDGSSYTKGSGTSRWIRGVNLGGWLVLERYIVPYQFALTDCHTRAQVPSDFCWYKGALSAPKYQPRPHCQDLLFKEKCRPALEMNIFNHSDYPVDEWHLGDAFESKEMAEYWFNTHFENFIKRDDLELIKTAGFTHIRIPLPHWVLGDVEDDEPWIVGKRWEAFQRAVQWAREIGLKVWPNLHTASGSQNGFDNSGLERVTYTAGGWWEDPHNVARTVRVLDHITARIKADGMLDVVTGFGLLNEPFGDCDMEVYTQFLDDALAVARRNLGEDAKIFVADRFASSKFNNGTWWLDEPNTYLDSHIYHVFAPTVRNYDPVQHLKRVCHPEEPENTISDCCWQDAPANTVPSKGVRRISTEWSGAFDAMPGELLGYVMKTIATNGTAPDFDRQVEEPRGDFLRRFIQAQMVVLEDEQVSDGWFYWTWKTEGGAFAEWDFLQGYKEGWFPKIVDPDKSSKSVYGTCDILLGQASNHTGVIHPYPWGDEPYWTRGAHIPNGPEPDDDDDKVVEHNNDDVVDNDNNRNGLEQDWNQSNRGTIGFSVLVLAAILGVVVVYLRRCHRRQVASKEGYTPVDEAVTDETTPFKV